MEEKCDPWTTSCVDLGGGQASGEGIVDYYGTDTAQPENGGFAQSVPTPELIVRKFNIIVSLILTLLQFCRDGVKRRTWSSWRTPRICEMISESELSDGIQLDSISSELTKNRTNATGRSGRCVQFKSKTESLRSATCTHLRFDPQYFITLSQIEVNDAQKQ